MKIKTPTEYCKAYLAAVYPDIELDKGQTIEVSCAFHAGIEAACKFMMEDFFSDNETDDEILTKRMLAFRKRNKDCAMHVNLLRFGE